MGTRCRALCQGCCCTDLETDKKFAEERLSEGLIQSGWGRPMGFCHLLPPLHSLLPTVTALLQFHLPALPFVMPSWVLTSTVSVFHMGLCTQAISMTIISDMRGKIDHDPCWKWQRGKFWWKFLEISWKGAADPMLMRSLCVQTPLTPTQTFPFSQLLVHCQKDLLAPKHKWPTSSSSALLLTWEPWIIHRFF